MFKLFKALLFLQDTIHYCLQNLPLNLSPFAIGYSICDHTSPEFWLWPPRKQFSPYHAPQIWITCPTIPFCSLSSPSKFTHSISHSTRGLSLKKILCYVLLIVVSNVLEGRNPGKTSFFSHNTITQTCHLSSINFCKGSFFFFWVLFPILHLGITSKFFQFIITM